MLSANTRVTIGSCCSLKTKVVPFIEDVRLKRRNRIFERKCVKRILPIQQCTDKWLRKSVYNDKYTFNLIETNVDNDKSDTTHTDMRNMQN